MHYKKQLEEKDKLIAKLKSRIQRLMANEMLVVAPDHGLIWCPNAKVATTTWYEILRRRMMPLVRTMPRCFPSACPDRESYKGDYPLVVPPSGPELAGAERSYGNAWSKGVFLIDDAQLHAVRNTAREGDRSIVLCDIRRTDLPVLSQ